MCPQPSYTKVGGVARLLLLGNPWFQTLPVSNTLNSRGALWDAGTSAPLLAFCPVFEPSSWGRGRGQTLQSCRFLPCGPVGGAKSLKLPSELFRSVWLHKENVIHSRWMPQSQKC